MGNKRKQARRAGRQALKSKPRIHGYEIDTIIVDELASAPALPTKPKRDNSPSKRVTRPRLTILSLSIPNH